MATDLQQKPDSDAEADNPEQKLYDDEFNALTSPEHQQKDGKSGDTGSAGKPQQEDRNLYNPDGDDKKRQKNALRRLLHSYSTLSTTKKWGAAAVGTTIVGLIVAGFIGMFSFLNIFKLDHLIQNIETAGFIRYQVDMDQRSSKWVKTYIMLRMGEVSNPELKPQDRDNIFFRSDRVDNNKPLTDWYRTMRASKFEQEVFEKEGIKFTSVAQWDKDKKIMKFRTGLITINELGDKPLDFKPTNAEINAIGNGEINNFNGRLSKYLDVEIFENNNQARKYIKDVVKKNTRWYQVMKRFYVRRAIYNMTGTRKWRFFDQTRQNASESIRSERNKIIAAAFPESMKSGRVVQCLFGITSCKTNQDTNNPKNRPDTSTLTGEICGESNSSAACDTGKETDTDNNPDTKETVKNDGTGGREVGAAVGGIDGEDGFMKKLISQLLGKLNIATSLVSIIDTLSRIDESIKNNALTTMVYNARLVQAIGMYTTYSISRDQIRSGEVSNAEVNDFMDTVNNAGTSEGWNRIYTAQKSSSVSASSMQILEKNKYCSKDNQAFINDPDNKYEAEKQYQWLCDSEKIGSKTLAATIQNGWNVSVGAILGPIFSAYRSTGLSFIVDKIDAVVSAILKPIISGTLKALGLADNVEALMGWVVAKVAGILGAGPAVQPDAPSGVFINHILMGSAASAETSARFQGAAITNSKTRAFTENTVARAEAEQQANTSLFERYASLNNSKSLLSNTLFSVTTNSLTKTVASSINTVINLPSLVLSGNARAASSPYTAAEFAGVETYDFPAECINQDPLKMTPQSSTNADDLGLIPAKELTWDLLEDSDTFYGDLYERHPNSDKIKKVYDCVALDSTMRGSLGATSNSDTLGSNAYDTSGTTLTSGTASSVRVGSYNVRTPYLNNSEFGDNDSIYDLDDVKRMQGVVKLIKENQLNIVGLQEAWVTTKDILNGLPNFKQAKSGAKSSLESRVIYDKTLYQELSAGYVTIPKQGSKTRPATWVKLQSRVDSGAQLIVFSLHASTANDTERREAANTVLNEAKRLSDGGAVPVIITGDMNSNDSRPGYSAVYNVFSSSGYLEYTRDLTSSRVNYNCNTHTAPETGRQACGAKGGKGSHIDQIWVSKKSRATVAKWTNVATKEALRYSDHNLVIADIEFPGTDAPGTDATVTGRDFVGKDGFGGGSCVDYVKYILARHSSKYKGGSMGDGFEFAGNLGRALGYVVDHKPAVHATVSFPKSLADPTFGHVALVAQVNPNGSIVVEEANWSVPNGYGTHTVDAKTAKLLTYAHTEKGWR